jgi:hypothetical protein
MRLPRFARNDKKEFVELLEFVGFLEFIGFLESVEFFEFVEMTRLVHPDRSGLARGKRGLLPDGMAAFSAQDSSEPRYLKIFTVVGAVAPSGSGRMCSGYTR